VHLTYIFIFKRGISSLPGCNSAAAIAQRDETGLDPGRAEAVEEVGLPGDFVFVEVGVAELANVDLLPLS
jgi:hypothetical protein